MSKRTQEAPDQNPLASLDDWEDFVQDRYPEPEERSSFRDYGTNVPLYPQFQAFFRERKPPTLIVWGKNDKIFPAAGATPYLRDLPDAELHLIDTGHFALEDKADEMIPLIRDFLCRKLGSR